jgi:hypothetical protein
MRNVDTSITTTVTGGGKSVVWTEPGLEAVSDHTRGLLRAQGYLGHEEQVLGQADLSLDTTVRVQESESINGGWLAGMVLTDLAIIGAGGVIGTVKAIDDGTFAPALYGPLIAAVPALLITLAFPANHDEVTATMRVDMKQRTGQLFYTKEARATLTDDFSGYDGDGGREELVGATLVKTEEKLVAALAEEAPLAIASAVKPGAGQWQPVAPEATAPAEAAAALAALRARARAVLGQSGVPFDRLYVEDFSGRFRNPDMPAVLAEAVQSEIIGLGCGITATTRQNMQDQLGVEERKEYLRCKEQQMCIRKIVDGFGISAQLFGVVRSVGKERYTITLTLTNRGQVVHVKRGEFRSAEQDLPGQAAALALSLLSELPGAN